MINQETICEAIQTSWYISKFKADTLKDHLFFWDATDHELHGMWLMLNYSDIPNKDELMDDIETLQGIANIHRQGEPQRRAA